MAIGRGWATDTISDKLYSLTDKSQEFGSSELSLRSLVRHLFDLTMF